MKLHWPTPLSLRHGSLRLRLLLSTLIWIAMAIAVAGWGLRDLFEKHIAQQLQNQLVHQLNQLSAAVNLSPEQTIEVQPIASDSRFATPLSGLYWQVDELPADAAPKLGVERSRSLWDQVLELPAHSARQSQPQGYAVLHLHALQGHTLLAVSRTLQLPEANAPLLRLTVAADQELLAEPLQRFTHMLLIALGLLAAGLVLAVVVQLQLALRPLQLLRQQLGTVRTGEATQLDGPFPHELQPLVSEFNHVLRANADIVQRARTQAGNLAHAVHTPLSILGNAAAQEDSPLALLVREQVATAQRQVDYHLARARAAAAVRATGLRTPVQQPLQALLRTMARLYPHIDFAQENDASQLAFKGEEQDLFEICWTTRANGRTSRSASACSLCRSSCRSALMTMAPELPMPSNAARFLSAASGSMKTAPAAAWGCTSCRSWPTPTAAACRRCPRHWAACGWSCCCRWHQNPLIQKNELLALEKQGFHITFAMKPLPIQRKQLQIQEQEKYSACVALADIRPCAQTPT